MAACSLSHVHVSLCLLVLVPYSNNTIIPALESWQCNSSSTSIFASWCVSSMMPPCAPWSAPHNTSNTPNWQQARFTWAYDVSSVGTPLDTSWQFYWQICSIALVIVYLPPWCLVEHPAGHQVVTSAISHHLLPGTLLCSLVCLLSDICAGALCAVLLT